MILGNNPKIKQISNHNQNAEIYKHVTLWVWEVFILKKLHMDYDSIFKFTKISSKEQTWEVG